MRLHLEADDGTMWLLEEGITGERAAMLLERAKAISEGVEEAYKRAEAGDQTAKALLENASCQQIAAAMGYNVSLASVVSLTAR